ncbi:hypothetical protein BpHYR1_036733 [Brachionus plicatilis]|uniref:Uncharacterized protein n=1 Tax=Brachionus plicatilis TaxID=10195 RepID=A0A3M7QUM7_BRAPC|nr:hypothetical protein BpHYR1_036733 [Brachionus plicatilis]
MTTKALVMFVHPDTVPCEFRTSVSDVEAGSDRLLGRLRLCIEQFSDSRCEVIVHCSGHRDKLGFVGRLDLSFGVAYRRILSVCVLHYYLVFSNQSSLPIVIK